MSKSSDLSVRQQRIVDALRSLFLAPRPMRSTRSMAGRCRSRPTSRASPRCRVLHRLATGLALAQELLVEEQANRSVFESPPDADELLTRTLRAALAMLDVR